MSDREYYRRKAAQVRAAMVKVADPIILVQMEEIAARFEALAKKLESSTKKADRV